MKPVSPVLVDQPQTAQFEIKIAEHQEQYQTLPALLVDEKNKKYVSHLAEADIVISRWELSDEEITKLLVTKTLYVWLWHGRGGHMGLTPVLVDVNSPVSEPEPVVDIARPVGTNRNGNGTPEHQG